MSKEHRDQMMELIDSFLDVVCGNGEPKEEKFNEPSTQPDGYETLVSAEEFEAIKGIGVAIVKYINVHNKNAMNIVDIMDKSSPYARIQYAILSDVVNDLQDAFLPVLNIHGLDKETIDEMAQKSKCDTVKEYESILSFNLMKKKILG